MIKKKQEVLEKKIKKLTDELNKLKEHFIRWDLEKFQMVEQALLKAQEQERKLDRVEKLTQSLFKERRKICQEYFKWCQKNNVVVEDAASMVTWLLCVKLKEVLNNESNGI